MNSIIFPRGKITPAEHSRPEPDAGGPPDHERTESTAHRLQTRVVQIDPVHLERERVLPPGALGGHGGPYKMLRTQVLRRLEGLGASTLAVVGATAETGKTLTAVNLAVAVAADPERSALLVDLDLRKPSIHLRLGLSPQLGVDDCLRSGTPLREAMVRMAGYERLVVLPARERAEDSSELLSGRRMHEMMLDMRNRYRERVLLFDLPPVLQADDVLAFAKYVQAVLVVVAEGKTRRDDLQRTFELLRDVPIVGTVLNGTREPVVNYY
ncbi:MAG: CpsD/CapB family tyrosine-protein kinase [Proteobacteria bacterium]|nr:CpsD/CapB family tyrosine-protein kinase [Pseudomonadota bacterium]